MTVVLASFLIFLALTFGLAVWAFRKSRGAKDFYAAGQNIGGVQNGLALAGDQVSAAGFLGVTGIIYLSGFDGLILPLSALLGWPLLLIVMAERMRRLGRYTFIDVLGHRLSGSGYRNVAAVAALCINMMYTIVQLVGGGSLLSLLLSIDYLTSLLVITALMAVYVALGGMVIATWIQMIKAALMVLGSAVFCLLILSRFDFSLPEMLRVAVDVHPRHAAIMTPGGSYFADPISGISLSLALALGLLGMPHVLMRFFTAPNAVEARRGAFWGTVIVSAFYAMLAVIGYGAIAIVTTDPAVVAAGGMPQGGQNMVVMYLARLVGGDAFFGFTAAVVFSTILAVVAGLAISSAATLSHDVARAFFPALVATERRELVVSRIGAVGVSLLSLVFALALQTQNIAILGTLALGTAASANFPVLLLALYWPGLTSRGAAAGMAAGLVSSIGLIAISPVVMVDVLGHDHAWLNLSNPTLIAMSLAFAAAYVFSTFDKSPDAAQSRQAFFAAQRGALAT